MPNGVAFHVLDVGQGDGNFIEVYGNGITNAATRGVLVDFGSAKSARIAGPKSTEFVVERLAAVAPPTGRKQLAVIILSHSDADHINLIPDLLEACAEQHITIGDCFYSGEAEHYTYRRHDILALIRDYAYPSGYTRSVRHLAASYSSYAQTGWPVWFSVDLLDVRCLIANAPGKQVLHKKTKRMRNEPNAGSLCLTCTVGNVGVQLTGDATYATFRAINSLLTTEGATGEMQDTAFIKIPHHGSSVTLADSGSDPYKQANDFTDFCAPVTHGIRQSVSASADFHIGFKHPSKEIMDLFSRHASSAGYDSPAGEPNSPEHRYSAYEDRGWKVLSTDVNTYTTMYTKTDRVQWSFLITVGGSVITGRIPSDAIALTFRRVTAPFARPPLADRDRGRRRRVLAHARRRRRR